MRAVSGFTLIAATMIAATAACTGRATCTTGSMRSCTITSEGGVTQNGYQACASGNVWSECVSVGTCTAQDGGPLPAYLRCSSSAACGPDSCGTCNSYGGVQNPNAFSLCYPFCQTDTDCAPTSAATAVTPKCILGQCALLCSAASQCPNDTQCLPWTNPDAGAQYPNSTGLCE